MLIHFTPQRRDDSLTLEKTGDTLTINGDALDLSVIPEGATLPDAHEIHPLMVGSITRENGEIELTFILPHGPNPSQAVAFPESVTVAVDGPIAVPFDEPADEPALDPEVNE